MDSFGDFQPPVVVDHGEGGQVVAARHPLRRGRYAEQVRAVTDEGDHRPVRLGQFHAEGGAGVPAERAAAGGDHRAGARRTQVFVDHLVVRDPFVEHQGVLVDLVAEAGREELGRDHLTRRVFAVGDDGRVLFVFGLDFFTKVVICR